MVDGAPPGAPRPPRLEVQDAEVVVVSITPDPGALWIGNRSEWTATSDVST